MVAFGVDTHGGVRWSAHWADTMIHAWTTDPTGVRERVLASPFCFEFDWEDFVH